MNKTTIDKIHTEITRVEPGHYVFNHDMMRVSKILYNAKNGTWQITTPGEHILPSLNDQKMVEILMGHCGFEADTSRVIAAALSMELASNQAVEAERDKQLAKALEARDASIQEMNHIVVATRENHEKIIEEKDADLREIKDAYNKADQIVKETREHYQAKVKELEEQVAELKNQVAVLQTASSETATED
jgi:DNA anti-recombination protein RmuC